MGLGNILPLLAASGTASLCFAVGLRFSQFVLTFLAGRSDARMAHLDAATKALIDELRAELDRLKKRCEECEHKHDESQKRLTGALDELAQIRAELLGARRLLMAGGEIKNMAQAVAAADKLFGEGKGDA